MTERAINRGEAAASRKIFGTFRDLLGLVVLLGDVLIGIGVPVALHGQASTSMLVAWGTLVMLTSYGWEAAQRIYVSFSDEDERRRDRWAWASTIVWAALPWIVFDNIHSPQVAWILVYVVVFGIITDLLYLGETDAPALDAMLVTYVGSFAIALASGGHILQIAAVMVAGGTLVGGSFVWFEVSGELVRRRERSEQEARTDSLTGLATRAAATEAVEELIAAGNPFVHCAFIDLDDFKHLNDNHGYDVGDAVLQAVGRELVASLPPSWLVARFGGDEFVAIGPDPVELDSLIDVQAEGQADAIFEITQSLSIGTTSLANADASASRLFREAAASLRFAKRLGKHQVLAMTDELRAVDELQAELGAQASTALESGEIIPWAQAIVDLDSRAILGYELLARWQRPDGSVVYPNEFVPIIEDQGRGPTLGLLMITHAVEALAQPGLRNRSTFISVNVSARHLYHRRLPAEILSLLGHHGVAPHRLVLEITESQHLPSSPIWRATAEELRTLGIGLAMDDLGTGYASVEQLLEFPFTHVKVDRLLSHKPGRPGTAELAAAIATIAAGADMVAIMEGIETEEQVQAMRAAGYRVAQGFLFHRPEPLADAIALSTNAPSTTDRR
jgi:diguanylate cyclase (GGDEF)-like protein